MALPIQSFINTLQNKGMRITNMWEATISTGYSDIDAKFKNITFFIDGFTAPARKQDTVPIAFKGYPLNVPSKMTMTTDHKLSVRCDVNGDVRRLFLRWMYYVTDAGISHGSFFGGEKRIPKNSVMRLNCLADDMVTVLETYKIYGCIPTSVGDLAMSNTEANLAMFDVSVVSQYWEVEQAIGDFPAQT